MQRETTAVLSRAVSIILRVPPLGPWGWFFAGMGGICVSVPLYYIIRYRSSIRKRVQEVELRLSTGLVYREVDDASAPSRTKLVRALELHPPFVEKSKKEGWKLMSLGQYLSTLRIINPLGHTDGDNCNDDDDDASSISKLLERELEATIGAALLRNFGPRLYPKWIPGSKNSSSSSHQHAQKHSSKSSTEQNKNKKKSAWLQTVLDNITSGSVAAGPRAIHYALYWLTAADALQSVLHNEYRDFVGTLASRSSFGTKNQMVPSVYSALFYFARLRPRLLYAVGALLRALQLCTPLGRILDPAVGVGAGINLCAMLASSRWVKPLVLGWATTKYMWRWLGAQRTQRAYLPITLSIREWEEQKSKKGGAKDVLKD